MYGMDKAGRDQVQGKKMAEKGRAGFIYEG